MAHTQFGHLAGSTGRGILMTLAAGLRVVDWAKAVCDGFRVVELYLIRLMGGVVHHAVAFVIESGGCFRIRGTCGNSSQAQQCDRRQDFHGLLTFPARGARSKYHSLSPETSIKSVMRASPDQGGNHYLPIRPTSKHF